MSEITIIPAGDHGAGQTGGAVDVSAFSTLRLTFQVTSANSAAFGGNPLFGGLNVKPSLQVWLSTSRNGVDWRRIGELRTVHSAQASEDFVVSNHDAFIRAEWSAHSTMNGVDPGFVWSITGDGKPDAAG